MLYRGTQHGIAARVAVAVVDAFEMVQVQAYDRKRPLVTVGPFNLFEQARLQGAAVQAAGQGVGDGQQAVVLGQRLQLLGALGHHPVQVGDVGTQALLQSREPLGHLVDFVGTGPHGAVQHQGLHQGLGGQFIGEAGQALQWRLQFAPQHAGDQATHQHGKQPVSRQHRPGGAEHGVDFERRVAPQPQLTQRGTALRGRDGDAAAVSAPAQLRIARLKLAPGPGQQQHITHLGPTGQQVQLFLHGVRLDVPQADREQGHAGAGNVVHQTLKVGPVLADHQRALHPKNHHHAAQRQAQRATDQVLG